MFLRILIIIAVVKFSLVGALHSGLFKQPCASMYDDPARINRCRVGRAAVLCSIPGREVCCEPDEVKMQTGDWRKCEVYDEADMIIQEIEELLKSDNGNLL